MKEAVFGEILTFLFAMVFFLQWNPFTLSISLFNYVKFGNYLERKSAGDASYQNVTDAGASFRANLVTTSRWNVKRLHP